MATNASSLFSEADRTAVKDAVQAAEARTAGEIVPVVAAASGRYDRAEDLFGLLAGLAAVALAWGLFQEVRPAAGTWASGYEPRLGLWAVLGLFLAGFWGGSFLAAVFTPLRLPFVSRREMEEEVERAAAEAFRRLRVSGARGGKGVLIYVSLFERRVRVLSDAEVEAKVSAEAWAGLCETVVAGLRAKTAAAGLCAAVAQAGELLAAAFPPEPDGGSRLSNELHLID